MGRMKDHLHDLQGNEEESIDEIYQELDNIKEVELEMITVTLADGETVTIPKYEYLILMHDHKYTGECLY